MWNPTMNFLLLFEKKRREKALCFFLEKEAKNDIG
jgi:hypothetical protein